MITGVGAGCEETTTTFWREGKEEGKDEETGEEERRERLREREKEGGGGETVEKTNEEVGRQRW